MLCFTFLGFQFNVCFSLFNSTSLIGLWWSLIRLRNLLSWDQLATTTVYCRSNVMVDPLVISADNESWSMDLILKSYSAQLSSDDSWTSYLLYIYIYIYKFYGNKVQAFLQVLTSAATSLKGPINIAKISNDYLHKDWSTSNMLE